MTETKKLNEEEYRIYLSQPMRLTDEYKATDIGLNVLQYAEDVLAKEGIEKPEKELKAGAVYRNADNTVEQVMYNYGFNDVYLVILVHLRNSEILGYFLLDFNKDF